MVGIFFPPLRSKPHGGVAKTGVNGASYASQDGDGKKGPAGSWIWRNPLRNAKTEVVST